MALGRAHPPVRSQLGSVFRIAKLIIRWRARAGKSHAGAAVLRNVFVKLTAVSRIGAVNKARAGRAAGLSGLPDRAWQRLRLRHPRVPTGQDVVLEPAQPHFLQDGHVAG
jgi:hypothetical protein